MKKNEKEKVATIKFETMKKYSHCIVVGTPVRILYCNNKSSGGVVESAAFNWNTKELVINTDYCDGEMQQQEILRHEIFEMLMVIHHKRFDPPDQRDNSIIVMEHKDIDPILSEYHAALASLC
jgi:hypothetical protein